MSELDAKGVGDYFARAGTISQWWTPGSGPLAFHYNAELHILEDQFAIDPNWKVLDVGTGPGRFGALFAGRGCQVIGIDLNPDMLEMANDTARGLGLEGQFEVKTGNAEDLSEFADSSFDVVCCMELFDHLPDLHTALAEMRRVLKPDGHFLYTYVPTESLYGCLGNIYRWLRARTRPSELMLSRTYSRNSICSLLAESGLQPERYWGVGVFCVSAQTRLFGNNAIVRALTAIARAEARRWPYYSAPGIARHGAHVVALARPLPDAAS